MHILFGLEPTPEEATALTNLMNNLEEARQFIFDHHDEFLVEINSSHLWPYYHDLPRFSVRPGAVGKLVSYLPHLSDIDYRTLYMAIQYNSVETCRMRGCIDTYLNEEDFDWSLSEDEFTMSLNIPNVGLVRTDLQDAVCTGKLMTIFYTRSYNWTSRILADDEMLAPSEDLSEWLTSYKIATAPKVILLA